MLRKVKTIIIILSNYMFISEYFQWLSTFFDIFPFSGYSMD